MGFRHKSAMIQFRRRTLSARVLVVRIGGAQPERKTEEGMRPGW